VPAEPSAVDAMLAAARARISVVEPREAAALLAAGALFVDTRPADQRVEFGGIPGALVIDRNVLEWRLDPTSAHRDPRAAAHVGPVVVFCQQGYSSILAVDNLTRLGLPDVHDLGGGFEAWLAAGLPTAATPGPGVGSGAPA
jgi:rhodanese-related sulfurtransferase